MRSVYVVLSLIFLVAFAASASVFRAEEYLISKSFFGGLAVDGYDTTAYFESGAPQKGSRNHTVKWHGAKWRFASEHEARLFETNPEAYAPQFGGYCTRAMSENKLASGDPEVWRLYEGKLYLFYAKKGAVLFDQDPAAMIAAAIKNYQIRRDEK